MSDLSLLQFKQKEVWVNNQRYLMNAIGGIDGLKLFNKLTALYAPIYTADSVYSVGKHIAAVLSAPESLEIQTALLGSVYKGNEQLTPSHFTCDYGSLVELLEEVIKFNFESGFKRLATNGMKFLGLTTP
jgi:hypothetical protein